MTVYYSIIQFIFWFAYGTAVNFSSVYLLECGLSNTAIGIISSAACALSVVLQPLLASYADREKTVSIKTILLFLFTLSGISGLILILSGENGNVEKADKMFSLCEEYGWTPVSMKNDWTTIYGDSVTRKTDAE